MEHDLILSNIAKHISLDSSEIEYFLSLLEIKILKKRDYLLKEGQPCTTINFVHEGALRAFYRGRDDKEATVMFAVRDWWITDMPCFVNQDPAMISIEVIEDSKLFLLSKENMNLLFLKVPKFERYFRIMMQNSYIREQLRVLQNLSLTAEERYINFIQRYPSIAQQVTQKHIASYLGITPEFLSAIRNKMRRGSIS